MSEKEGYAWKISGLMNLKAFETSDAVEFWEYVALSLIAVLVPFLLRGPQLLVGSTVNFMLALCAVNVRGWKKITPLIVLPSLSALAGGFLFGPFTIFLVYMVPFIWIGNTILVLVFKYLYVGNKKKYWLTLGSAAFLKAAFLFSVAFILVLSGVLPPVFLMAMGLVQLATALIGGTFAYPVTWAYRKYLMTGGV